MLRIMTFITAATWFVSCDKLTNPSSGNQKSTDSVAINSDDDKAIYALGKMYRDRSNYLGLSDHEIEVLVAGMRDVKLPGTDDLEDRAKTQSLIQKFVDGRMKIQSEAEKVLGSEYMKKFLSEGGQKTASGLGYKIIKEGKADAKPKAGDMVEVDYHGTRVNGDVFDSSIDRGQTAKFPLSGVIPGWSEGLQLVGEGGEIELVIPSDLAYGEMGSQPKIPGGATLLFKVILHKVSKGKEEGRMNPAHHGASKEKAS